MKIAYFWAFAWALAPVMHASAASPYAGQEGPDIKALSQQEIESYLGGKGMGYAKAAELNHYPGPRHVLDLAQELHLSVEQTQRTQAIFDAMNNQAVTLGEQFVAKERELDGYFASGSVDAESLERLVLEIGALQARIRYVHLNAHLQQKALLTDQQVQLYDRLRGYGAPHNSEQHHSH